jgi:hypothetical protein
MMCKKLTNCPRERVGLLLLVRCQGRESIAVRYIMLPRGGVSEVPESSDGALRSARISSPNKTLLRHRIVNPNRFIIFENIVKISFF